MGTSLRKQRPSTDNIVDPTSLIAPDTADTDTVDPNSLIEGATPQKKNSGATSLGEPTFLSSWVKSSQSLLSSDFRPAAPNKQFTDMVQQTHGFTTPEDAMAYVTAKAQIQPSTDQYRTTFSQLGVADPESFLKDQSPDDVAKWYFQQKEDLLTKNTNLRTIKATPIMSAAQYDRVGEQGLGSTEQDRAQITTNDDLLSKLDGIRDRVIKPLIGSKSGSATEAGLKYMQLFEPGMYKMLMGKLGINPQIGGVIAKDLAVTPAGNQIGGDINPSLAKLIDNPATRQKLMDSDADNTLQNSIMDKFISFTADKQGTDANDAVQDFRDKSGRSLVGIPQSFLKKIDERGHEAKILSKADEIVPALDEMTARTIKLNSALASLTQQQKATRDPADKQKIQGQMDGMLQTFNADPFVQKFQQQHTEFKDLLNSYQTLGNKYPDAARKEQMAAAVEERYGDQDVFTRQFLQMPGAPDEAVGAYGLFGRMTKAVLRTVGPEVWKTYNAAAAAIGVMDPTDAYFSNYKIDENFNTTFSEPNASQMDQYTGTELSPSDAKLAQTMGINPSALAFAGKPKFQFNWGGITGTIGDAAGAATAYGAMGNAAGGIFSDVVGAAGGSAARLGASLGVDSRKVSGAMDWLKSADVANDKVGLFASTMATTYGDNYNRAIDAGLSPGKAEAYAMLSSTGTALAYSILPESKLQREIMGNVPSAATIKDIAETMLDVSGAKKESMVAGMKKFLSATLGTELKLTSQAVLDTYKTHMLDAAYGVNTTQMGFAEDAEKTALHTAIGMIPMSVMGAYGKSNSLRRESLYKAGLNPEALQSFFDDQLASVSPEDRPEAQKQVNASMKVAHTMAEIIGDLPETNASGRTLTLEERTHIAENLFKARKLNADIAGMKDESLIEPAANEAAAASEAAKSALAGTDPAYIINNHTYDREKFMDFLNSEDYTKNKDKFKVEVVNDPATKKTTDEIVGDQQGNPDLTNTVQHLTDLKAQLESDIKVSRERAGTFEEGDPQRETATFEADQSQKQLDLVNERLEVAKDPSKLKQAGVETPAAGNTLNNQSAAISGGLFDPNNTASPESKIGEGQNKSNVIQTEGQPFRTQLSTTEGDESDRVGANIKEKFINAPKAVVDQLITKTLPNGDKISGRYALVPAEAVTASHDPVTFGNAEGFPLNEQGKTINDRDYSLPENKARVSARSLEFDDRAVENIPTVSPDGIVIDGNDRTMSGQLAAAQKTDNAYDIALKQRLPLFGLSEDNYDYVAASGRPRLVFVTDEVPKYTTETFAKFNKSEGKEKSPLARAIELGRTVSDDTLRRVANEFEAHDTMGEFYNNRKSTKNVFDILEKNDVLSHDEMTAYYNRENGAVTLRGKEFLESLMLGKLVGEDELALLGKDGIRSYRQKIVRNIRTLSEIEGLGSDFSIKEPLNEAIRLRDRLLGSEMSLDDYVNQTQLFENTIPTGEAVLMHYNMEAPDKVFKEFLNTYLDRAKEVSTGVLDIFNEGLKNREEIFTQLTKKLSDEQRSRINEANTANEGQQQTGAEQRNTDVTDTGEESGSVQPLAEQQQNGETGSATPPEQAGSVQQGSPDRMRAESGPVKIPGQENTKEPTGKVSTSINKAIEVLERMKVDTKGKLFDATIGLPVSIYNSAIDVIQAALHGGAKIAEAIEAGIGHIRETYKGKLNDEKFRNHMYEMLGEERKGKTVDAGTEAPPLTEIGGDLTTMLVRGLEHVANIEKTLGTEQEALERVYKAAGSEGSANAVIINLAAAMKKQFGKKGKEVYETLRKVLTQSRLNGLKERWTDWSRSVENAPLGDIVSWATESDYAAKYNMPKIEQVTDSLQRHALFHGLTKDVQHLIGEHDFEGVRDTLSVSFQKAAHTIQDLAWGENKSYETERARPDVQQAKQIYKDIFADKVEAAHVEVGGSTIKYMGEEDTYIPLTQAPEDREVKRTIFGNLSSLRRPTAPYNDLATGLGKEYDISVDALRKRIVAAYNAKDRTSMIDALKTNGYMVQWSSDKAEDLINIDNKFFKATKVNINEGTQLKASYYLMPDKVYQDVKSLLGFKPKDDSALKQAFQKVNGAITGMALGTPREALRHASNLLFRVNKNTAFAFPGTAGESIGRVPILKQIMQAGHLVFMNPTADKWMGVLKEMAAVGEVPLKYGSHTFSADKAEMTGAQKDRIGLKKQFPFFDMQFGSLLYSDKGIDIRARMMVWQISKSLNPDATPADMRKVMSGLGDYNKAFQADVVKVTKDMLAISPFIVSQHARMVGAFKSFNPMPSGSSLPLEGLDPGKKYFNHITNLLQSSVYGYMGMWAASYLAKTGKNPFTTPGARLGVIPNKTGTNDDGGIGLGAFYNMASVGTKATGMDAFFSAIHQGANTGQAIEKGLIQAFNTDTSPLLSGSPVAHVYTGLFGVTPYILSITDDKGQPAIKMLPTRIPVPAGYGFAANLFNTASHAMPVVGMLTDEAMKKVYGFSLNREANKDDWRKGLFQATLEELFPGVLVNHVDAGLQHHFFDKDRAAAERAFHKAYRKQRKQDPGGDF